MAARPELRIEIVHACRQPAWGRITMTIAITVKQVRPGDGHARAERREKAWYRL